MSEAVIHDLDVLRPAPEYVKLAGKKIDISFIPAGVAMDVMAIQQEMQALTDSPEKLKQIEAGGDDARKSFELAAGMCAKIVEAQYPEMNMDWLMRNTDVLQLKALMDHVTRAVFKSFENAEEPEVKKQPAAEASP